MGHLSSFLLFRLRSCRPAMINLLAIHFAPLTKSIEKKEYVPEAGPKQLSKESLEPVMYHVLIVLGARREDGSHLRSRKQ